MILLLLSSHPCHLYLQFGNFSRQSCEEEYRCWIDIPTPDQQAFWNGWRDCVLDSPAVSDCAILSKNTLLFVISSVL